VKKIILALILFLLLIGCNSTKTEIFAVYLADTHQMIFSEEDITSYDATTNTFTFTEEGAKKMQSYQTSMYLDDGLYQKAFVAKLGDEKLYSGKFWSLASSLAVSDIIMSDVLMISPDYNILTVTADGYPTFEFTSDSDNSEKINAPKLIEHFKKINKLK